MIGLTTPEITFDVRYVLRAKQTLEFGNSNPNPHYDASRAERQK
jgi:hypothetical protein